VLCAASFALCWHAASNACSPQQHRINTQALWGDWCYLPKEKRVVKGSKARSAAAGSRSAPRTMFEVFALEPVWRAYSVCEGEDVQASMF
jgi:hypothetical protein